MSKTNYHKEAELEQQWTAKIAQGFTGFGNNSMPLDSIGLSHLPPAKYSGKVFPAGGYKNPTGDLALSNELVDYKGDDVQANYLPHLAVASVFLYLLFLGI